MSAPTKSHVIKITGVPDEMLRLMDERVKSRHFGGRAEYVRELIRRDVLDERQPTLREILKPIHDQSPEISEEELDELVEAARNEVFSAKQASASER